jgi:predicted DNA-binding transcriptional regulator AlpA
MTPLLNQKEAAAILAISVRTLERLRVTGSGPRFVKISHGVCYRTSDIETWLASRTRASTSAPETGGPFEIVNTDVGE